MDTLALIDNLEKTASELEALAAQPTKQASEAPNPYTSFLEGMVEKLGLE